jgi:hypothetical protein
MLLRLFFGIHVSWANDSLAQVIGEAAKRSVQEQFLLPRL